MSVASRVGSGEIERDHWVEFLSEFSKRNRSRATRLETFGDLGALEEERNLPLNGIGLERSGADAPRIEIMLGGVSPKDERHMAHTITRVTRLAVKTDAEGRDEALEIEDAEGAKTLLRLESLPELNR